MNETMSLLLATTILAIGGFGLFMYKSSDDKEDVYENDSEEYNEDTLFGSKGGFWGSEEEPEPESEVIETKVRPKTAAAKTKRNRKTTGSKRRY